MTDNFRPLSAQRPALFTFLLALSLGLMLPISSSEANSPIEVTAQELSDELKAKIQSVAEFREIREEAAKLGVRVWLFGGTAAAYAHYVRWNLLRAKGDTRFVSDRFDFDYTNIFRSTQDMDLVIDGNAEKSLELQNRMQQIFPYFAGEKAAWEVRPLAQPMPPKRPLLGDRDFLNQHSDSHSTGLIELTESGEPIAKDIRDWNSEVPKFLQDVVQGRLTYYYSENHNETEFAARGDNPAIFSALRYLTKAFQYDLRVDSVDLQKIQMIINQFNPQEDIQTGYAKGRIKTLGTNLIRHSVDLEKTEKTIREMGLKSKLLALGNPNEVSSMAWWVNKKPLASFELGRGSGKTAKELNIDIVAHETNSFTAFESIQRAHTGEANVLISRQGAAGEVAVSGDGFYTARGEYGLRDTGWNLRFHLLPEAREGSDFSVFEEIVVIHNKRALRVIIEDLNFSLKEYFDVIWSTKIDLQKHKGILEKFKRRVQRPDFISTGDVNYVFNMTKRDRSRWTSDLLLILLPSPTSLLHIDEIKTILSMMPTSLEEITPRILSQLEKSEYSDLRAALFADSTFIWSLLKSHTKTAIDVLPLLRDFPQYFRELLGDSKLLLGVLKGTGPQSNNYFGEVLWSLLLEHGTLKEIERLRFDSQVIDGLSNIPHGKHYLVDLYQRIDASKSSLPLTESEALKLSSTVEAMINGSAAGDLKFLVEKRLVHLAATDDPKLEPLMLRIAALPASNGPPLWEHQQTNVIELLISKVWTQAKWSRDHRLKVLEQIVELSRNSRINSYVIREHLSHPEWADQKDLIWRIYKGISSTSRYDLFPLFAAQHFKDMGFVKEIIKDNDPYSVGQLFFHLFQERGWDREFELGEILDKEVARNQNIRWWLQYALLSNNGWLAHPKARKWFIEILKQYDLYSPTFFRASENEPVDTTKLRQQLRHFDSGEINSELLTILFEHLSFGGLGELLRHVFDDPEMRRYDHLVEGVIEKYVNHPAYQEHYLAQTDRHKISYKEFILALIQSVLSQEAWADRSDLLLRLIDIPNLHAKRAIANSILAKPHYNNPDTLIAFLESLSSLPPAGRAEILEKDLDFLRDRRWIEHERAIEVVEVLLRMKFPEADVLVALYAGHSTKAVAEKWVDVLIERSDARVASALISEVFSDSSWRDHPRTKEWLLKMTAVSDVPIKAQMVERVFSRTHANDSVELLDLLLKTNNERLDMKIERLMLTEPHWQELLRATAQAGTAPLSAEGLRRLHKHDPRSPEALAPGASRRARRYFDFNSCSQERLIGEF